MSRWVDIEATIRVYVPDDAPDMNVSNEGLAEQADMALRMIADGIEHRGFLVSVLDTDPGELADDTALNAAAP